MGYQYSSVARATELSESVSGSATVLKVGSVAGFPSPPFTLIVDVSTPSEEIVTVTAVSGLNLTAIRGEDGSSGVPHQTGAVVRHGLVARDARQIVSHVEATTGVHGLAPGDSVVGSGTVQALTNKTISGAQNTLTNLPGGAINPGTVGAAQLGSDAVETAKVKALAVTEAKLAAGAVTETKLGSGAVSSTKLADDAVTSAKVADGAITTTKIAENAVTSFRLANAAVTDPKIVTVSAEKIVDTPAGIRWGGTAQNIPTGSTTNYSFPGGNSAYNGAVSGSSGGSMTTSLGGWYIITANMRWVPDGTGFRAITITVNDTVVAVQHMAASGAAAAGQNVTAVARLSAGAVVRMQVHQSSGGNLAADPDDSIPRLSLAWVGRS